MVQHCKAKPYKAYRELPVSQFPSQAKTYFHSREPCSHCRNPVFNSGISLQNPVHPCTGGQCIDKSAKTKKNPNGPKCICPNCLSNPKSSRFQCKKASLGIRDLNDSKLILLTKLASESPVLQICN